MICHVLNSAWQFRMRPDARRFERALRRPGHAQAEKLDAVVRGNAESWFGREHRFAGINGWAQFRDRTPIRNGDEYMALVDRIRTGEPRVLTMAPVKRLVPTSGTTGAARLIPFTHDAHREFNAAIAPWLCDLFRQHPGLKRGPAYWSISPYPRTEFGPSAVPLGFGDDTEYLPRGIRWLAQRTQAVRLEIAHAPSLETWRFATMLSLMRCDTLRLISIWHPSFLELLLDFLIERWDELLGALETGYEFVATDGRTIRLPHCRARARALRCAAPDDVSTIWPHLEVISAWGDAASQLPLEGLRRRLPGVQVQPKGLLATEGVTSVPYAGTMPLALRSHVFEFIASDGSVLDCTQLEPGAEYDTVITTGAGLYRYRTGDRVRVTGRLHATPTIRFIGRSNTTSDLCGEKLTDHQVNEAIQTLLTTDTTAITFAALMPDTRSRPYRYVLVVNGKPSDGLADDLDTALQQNPHYAICREIGQLSGIMCVVVPEFERAWLERHADTRGLGNVKATHLISDDSLLRELDTDLTLRCPAPSLSQ